jgi:hypothetical protein
MELAAHYGVKGSFKQSISDFSLRKLSLSKTEINSKF